jgi:hypothetical protein
VGAFYEKKQKSRISCKCTFKLVALSLKTQGET